MADGAVSGGALGSNEAGRLEPAFPGLGVGSIRGAGSQVDYRLVRRSLIGEFKRGRITRQDVCDAHPELLRAARNVGEPTSLTCPICEEAQVALVSYAFGPRLGPAGRCVTNRAELQRLVRAAGGPVTTYVVEVCPNCAWNHLTRAFEVAPPGRTNGRAGSRQR
jgi:hypothetical protein